MSKLVNKIFSILKRRRYNREKPYQIDEFKQRIDKFVLKKAPIHLVGFWGVGPKTHVNWADQETCDFLQDLNHQLVKVYPPGIDFEFIFSEPHGVHNGLAPETMTSYVLDVKKLFKNYGFRHQNLKPLWDKYEITFDKIDQLLSKKSEGWWQKIQNHEGIENNAKSHNQRLPAIEAAQKYVIMRDLEKEIWEKEYPSSIFHAFADSKLRAVLPNLPTLYFFSRKGWSNIPWFTQD